MEINSLILIGIAIPIGILIGISTGVVGQTANAIIVPLLFIMFGVNLLIAIGSSLLIDFIDTMILSIIYGKRKIIEYKLSIVLGITGGLASYLGSFITFNYLVTLGGTMKIIYILILIGIAIFFINKGFKTKKDLKEDIYINQFKSLSEFFSSGKLKIAIIFGLSIIYGFLAGLLGVGGGMVITTGLIIIYQMKTRRATGTGVFYMFIVSLMANIPYISYSPVDVVYFGIFIFGIAAICGTLISSFIVHKVSERILNLLVGIILIVFTLVLIVQQILIY